MRKVCLLSLVVFLVAIIYMATNMSSLATNGIQVSPTKIEIEIGPGETKATSLHIYNNQESVANFSVYLEDESFSNWTSFDSSEFSLQSDEMRTIEFKIKLPYSASGDCETKICILCNNDSYGTGIATGVKVPVKISVSQSNSTDSSEVIDSISEESVNPYIVVGISVIGLVFIIFCIWQYSRSRPSRAR